MSFIKNKNNKDYTNITRSVYNILSNQLGYTARISDIWKLLRLSCGLEGFEILDPVNYQNGKFEAYLLDQQIDWQNGKDLNFSEIKETILTVGDFTSTEKYILGGDDIEERLWAIFLCVCDPTMNL